MDVQCSAESTIPNVMQTEVTSDLLLIHFIHLVLICLLKILQCIEDIHINIIKPVTYQCRLGAAGRVRNHLDFPQHCTWEEHYWLLSVCGLDCLTANNNKKWRFLFHMLTMQSSFNIWTQRSKLGLNFQPVEDSVWNGFLTNYHQVALKIQHGMNAIMVTIKIYTHLDSAFVITEGNRNIKLVIEDSTNTRANMLLACNTNPDALVLIRSVTVICA